MLATPLIDFIKYKMFPVHDVDVTISQIRVIYIVVLKLEAEAGAQSFRKWTAHGAESRQIHLNRLHFNETLLTTRRALCWSPFLPL